MCVSYSCLELSYANRSTQEDIWEEDANAFVRDESEGVEAYTARVASLDIVGVSHSCLLNTKYLIGS